jgi:hypothetical protein
MKINAREANMASRLSQRSRKRNIGFGTAELNGFGPRLHRAIREVYRLAMQDWHTQEEAFTDAITLFRRYVPSTKEEEARRLVARMLTEEPAQDLFASVLRRQESGVEVR